MKKHTPLVNQLVHYVSYGTPGGEYASQCRAAVVTEIISEDLVSLAVLNPTGLFFNQRVPRDASDEPRGGTWHDDLHAGNYKRENLHPGNYTSGDA
jgi:hypothetical protein